MIIGSQLTFWLLNQFLRTLWSDFIWWLLNITYFSPLKSKNFTLKSLMYDFWLLTLFSTFFNFLDALWASKFEFKYKQCTKKIVLHLIVVPQLSSGWQHKYSTKTRQASHANEHYSLMSMVTPSYLMNVKFQLLTLFSLLFYKKLSF
jgi:hypothetical protein